MGYGGVRWVLVANIICEIQIIKFLCFYNACSHELLCNFTVILNILQASMLSECTIILTLYYHCTTIVLPLYYHYTTIVLPLYNHYTTIILPLYYHYTTIILPLYYHYTTIILPLYWHYSIILPLYYYSLCRYTTMMVCGYV